MSVGQTYIKVARTVWAVYTSGMIESTRVGEVGRSVKKQQVQKRLLVVKTFYSNLVDTANQSGERMKTVTCDTRQKVNDGACRAFSKC